MRYSIFEVMITVQVSWHMTPCGLVNNYRQYLSAARHGVIFNNFEGEGIEVFRNLGNYQSPRRIPESLCLQNKMSETRNFAIYSEHIVFANPSRTNGGDRQFGRCAFNSITSLSCERQTYVQTRNSICEIRALKQSSVS